MNNITREQFLLGFSRAVFKHNAALNKQLQTPEFQELFRKHEAERLRLYKQALKENKAGQPE